LSPWRRVRANTRRRRACDYIDADLRDTGTVLRRTAETLDFGKPVAVMVLGRKP
jgi:S-adenosyl methyltransferase